MRAGPHAAARADDLVGGTPVTTTRTARRLGAIVLAVGLTAGLAAPAVAAPGSAATLGERGSDRGAGDDDGSARASAQRSIQVRDLRFSCPDDRVPESAFRDTAGSPFDLAIDCLVWYGVTEGRSPTAFEPNASVTRRQMALFLHRLLEDVLPPREMPTYDGTSDFRDVPDSGVGSAEINVLASPEIEELLGTPIVTGRGDGTYDPSGTVTRAQMGSFIARVIVGVADYYDATITRGSCTFPDQADIPEVHADNVSLLCELGIVGGRNDGTYGPRADVTRGQMAAFLTRTLDVFVEARITVPPDERSEVNVRSGASSCATADGSPAQPFCTIQAGVTAAELRDDAYVEVLVEPGTYAEDVVITGGAVPTFVLVASAPGRTPLDGSITVAAPSEDGVVAVIGFDVSDGARSLSAGEVLVIDSQLRGDTALLVDQPGGASFTGVSGSTVAGATRGMDIVASGSVPGTVEVAFSPAGPPAESYVVLPAGIEPGDGEDAPGVLELFTDPATRNTFPDEPRAAQLPGSGRWALVPA